MTQLLRVTEIFFSLQGEANTVGIPTIFIRLTGCPLRCQYCDTAYAFRGGNRQSMTQVLTTISQYQSRYITVTGGEPLAQPACFTLLTTLCDKNYLVSLETSGAIDMANVDDRVIKVMDIKTPASLEAEKMHWQNLTYLKEQDQIKFVICNETDYQWAKSILVNLRLAEKCQVLFSPNYQALAPQQLANWILQDQLPVRFQIQLHKYLWGESPGH